MQRKTSGLFLILLGVIIFVYKLSWVSFDAFFSWSFLAFIVGALLIFFAFVYRISQFALVGGIISTLGISIWGAENITRWPTHFSILSVMIGLSVLLQFLINRNNITALVGSILLTSGILTWPGIRTIPGIAPIANLFFSYWPVLLIALGTLLLLNKR